MLPTPSPDTAAETFLADLHQARLEAIAVLRRILHQPTDDTAAADPAAAQRTREARLAATAILRIPLPKPLPASPAPEPPPAPSDDDDALARAEAQRQAIRGRFPNLFTPRPAKAPAATAAFSRNTSPHPRAHHATPTTSAAASPSSPSPPRAPLPAHARPP